MSGNEIKVSVEWEDDGHTFVLDDPHDDPATISNLRAAIKEELFAGSNVPFTRILVYKEKRGTKLKYDDKLRELGQKVLFMELSPDAGHFQFETRSSKTYPTSLLAFFRGLDSQSHTISALLHCSLSRWASSATATKESGHSNQYQQATGVAWADRIAEAPRRTV